MVCAMATPTPPTTPQPATGSDTTAAPTASLFTIGIAVLLGGLLLVTVGLYHQHVDPPGESHPWDYVAWGALVAVAGVVCMLAAVARAIEQIAQLHAWMALQPAQPPGAER